MLRVVYFVVQVHADGQRPRPLVVEVVAMLKKQLAFYDFELPRSLKRTCRLTVGRKTAVVSNESFALWSSTKAAHQLGRTCGGRASLRSSA